MQFWDEMWTTLTVQVAAVSLAEARNVLFFLLLVGFIR
jgi:hypothetical protein